MKLVMATQVPKNEKIREFSVAVGSRTEVFPSGTRERSGETQAQLVSRCLSCFAS